jgi:hypothetical protein
MGNLNVDPMKKSSIYSIFGKYYGEKLYRLLYDCCNGQPGSFCYEVLKCIGVSSQGDVDLVLNQQGEWVEKSAPQFQYEIGQYVEEEGGVIFHRWLSTSAYGTPTFGTVQNYLVIDTIDLNSGASAPWANLNVNISNVGSSWDGKTNTPNLITAGEGGGIDPGTAAVLCDTSTRGGKSDWYLPALDELSKIWQNRIDVSQGVIYAGGTLMQQGGGSNYWSSTQASTSEAMYFLFQGGYGNPLSKANGNYVRAVRKFSI